MKLSEMREKTVEELKQFVVDSKKQLLEARIKKSMHKLENTAEISKTKRLVAQAKTVFSRISLNFIFIFSFKLYRFFLYNFNFDRKFLSCKF